MPWKYGDNIFERGESTHENAKYLLQMIEQFAANGQYTWRENYTQKRQYVKKTVNEGSRNRSLIRLDIIK